MPSFEDEVTDLFRSRFHALFRYLDRLTGDPDLAADLAQEAFVRLYQRGTLPDEPHVWLVTVATNHFRDMHRRTQRREALVAKYASDAAPSASAVMPEHVLATEDARTQVQQVLRTLLPRDQQLLLLRHEGYSYREIAKMTGIAEASVGTLLLRATRAFETAFIRHDESSTPN